jgi:ABC-type transport system involved in multi-copper enzyme maturation permease subunit
MFRTLVFKELLDSLLSLRFVVGLVLCSILTVTSAVILTHDYRQQMSDYNQRVSMQNDFVDKYAHRNRLYGMIIPQKPPEDFRPFVTGIDREGMVDSFNENPLPVLFQPLDLLFIVTIIVSLMAILFSYDAISGERERGTLKLMVSNSLGRAWILLAKWLGGTAALLAPFFFSVLAGALYVATRPDLAWDQSAFLTLALLVLASVVFISLFYLLGLLVSCFSPSSSASILSSIFLWVLIVLVFPNLSPYVAAQVYRIPSVTRVEREISRLTDTERDNLGRQFVKELQAVYTRKYGAVFTEYLSMSKDQIRERVARDPEFKNLHEIYTKEDFACWVKANEIQDEKANKIRKDLELKASRQARAAKLLAAVSPYSDYVYLATDLTGTGLRSLEYYGAARGKYMDVFWKYVSGKEEEAKSKDPTYDVNSYLDLKDRPRFDFREEPLRDRVQGVLPWCGVLVFFNLLLFAVSYVRFMRCDVR